MGWASDYAASNPDNQATATPSPTASTTPTSTGGWAAQYAANNPENPAAQAQPSGNPVMQGLGQFQNLLKPTSGIDLNDQGASMGTMAADFGGNVVKDLGSILGGIGTAAVALPLGVGGDFYQGVTGNAPQNNFVSASQKIVNGAPAAILDSAKGLGSWANDLVTPGKSAAAVQQAGDYAYQHPLGLLANISGGAKLASMAAKGAGKIAGNVADNAALDAVRAGLPAEEAATASLGAANNPLADLGSKLDSVSNYTNPLPAFAKPIDPSVSIKPNFAARTAAGIGGSLASTDPQTLLQRFSNPAETGASVAANFNPQQVVDAANGAIRSTAAARSGAYRTAEANLLTSLPADHPFNGLTDSPESVYKPGIMDGVQQALADRKIGIQLPDQGELNDMRSLSDSIMKNGTQDLGNGIIHNADTPYGTANAGVVGDGLNAAANRFGRSNAMPFMQDMQRFNDLYDKYGITAQRPTGSGFGFTNKSQLGLNTPLAAKAKAMSDFLQNNPPGPSLDFSSSGLNDAEQSTLQKAVNGVYNNQDWTANGINNLKHGIDGLYRPTDNTNAANPLIKQIKSTVEAPLTSIPGYSDMNSRYRADSQMLDQMKGVAGDYRTQNPMQQLSKLMSMTKSKNPITQEVLDRIQAAAPAGSPDIRNQIAAYLTSNNDTRTPTLGEFGAAAMSPHSIPAIIGSILASSPQKQGNFMAGLGRMAQSQRSPVVSGYRNAVTNPAVASIIQAIGRNSQP